MRTLMVVVTRFLLLGSLLLALPAVITAQPTPQSPPPYEDRYAPIRFGIPDTIGGYPILAVLTDEPAANAMSDARASGVSWENGLPVIHQPCMMPGKKRLVLQSPEPTIEEALSDFSRERLEQDLQALNLTEYSQWGWTIVGPGITQEELVRLFAEYYPHSNDNGCVTLGPPKITSSPAARGEKTELATPYKWCNKPPKDGEIKCSTSAPGWAVIQNLDDRIGKADGQGVYLVAPKFGDNQEACGDLLGHENINCYSAFLNNVLTDKDYFLQVGLYFKGPNYRVPFHPAQGLVVWTDDANGLQAQTLPIEYKPNHEYLTVIIRHEKRWQICAADMADESKYSCEESPEKKGTKLKKDRLTSVWAENFNKNIDWHKGFSPKWEAYGASVIEEKNTASYPHLWSDQRPLTVDACEKPWLPKNAISGSLKDGGTAYFETQGIPLYCEVATGSKPQAPSDVSLTIVSGGAGIGVSWRDNSNNEEGFDISYSPTQNSSTAKHKRVGAKQTFLSSDWELEYDKNGRLKPGQKMCFQVSAYNAAGRSKPTPWKCITVPQNQHPPKIVRVETFREGVLVFFRLFYTDPNNNAEGFGFRGVKGSGWAEETHPFSSPSYGRWSPGKIEYPFNHLCGESGEYESDVEAWIYDSTGLRSPSVTIHLACSDGSIAR